MLDTQNLAREIKEFVALSGKTAMFTELRKELAKANIYIEYKSGSSLDYDDPRNSVSQEVQ